MFQEAEALLSQNRFTEVIALLDRVPPQSLSTEERGYCCILKSEAMLYLGLDPGDLIDQASEVFRMHAEAEKFARAKLLKGWYLTTIGRYADSREALLEAYANYLRCRHKRGAARALNRLAFVHRQLGHYRAAEENLTRSAEIYRELADEISMTGVLTNRAYLLMSGGSLRCAETEYSKMRDTVVQAGEKNVVAHGNMSAMCYALLGDLTTARRTIDEGKPYLDTYIREKAIYHENLGLIEILSGNYEAAEQSLQTGLDISLQIAPESALVSQIKRLFADLYIQTQHWTKAEKFAREALAVAKQINERLEIAACWRVFAQVENHRGNHDQARAWFDQAIDLFNQIGSRYELAVTRCLAALSNLYDRNKRVALLYLAREYFESEGVAPWLTRVTEALENEAPPAPRARPAAAAAVIVGADKSLRQILALAEHAAPTDFTVFLTGETGTGKDLLARHIHACSGRKGEFVAVNAAAIPTDMIEAELFGHVMGAFTGAAADRRGLFEQAAHGTFYLDEIADASPLFQAKLLQVLESRQIRPLGQNGLRPLTCRFVAATNHDLHDLLKSNAFRPDLFHRLNHVPIHLPPLRERLSDIPLLVEHFLKEDGIVARSRNETLALERLCRLLAARSWPGNVRQLRSVVLRLAMIGGRDLPRMVEAARADIDQPCEAQDELLYMLQTTGWNRRETARRLGVSEATVRRRIAEFDLAVQIPQPPA